MKGETKMLKKILTLTLITTGFVSIAMSAKAQVTEMEKLKARKEILKRTTELNALEIELNKEIQNQAELQVEAERAKSEVNIYSAKSSNSDVTDVKAAKKLAGLVKKSTKLSTKLSKKNLYVEKLKSKVEKVKSGLNKLNGNVLIYTDKENPFSN